MDKVNITNEAVNALQIQLKKLGRDYLLVERLSDQNVDIQFVGAFQGCQVVWNATIRTIDDYYHAELKQSADDKVELRQFIEIEKREDSYRICLVLNLDKIDNSAIQKSIIMIRQYKRLSPGRHEYGEIHYYNI